MSEHAAIACPLLYAAIDAWYAPLMLAYHVSVQRPDASATATGLNDEPFGTVIVTMYTTPGLYPDPEKV